MIFNPKHSHINNLFAELGCVIGKLGDSSKYDERFIDIADRVIALNEGGKVDRKVLIADIDLMLNMLEREGYSYERKIIKQEKRLSPVKERKKIFHCRSIWPFHQIKSYWILVDMEGKWSIVLSLLFPIGIAMMVLAIHYNESWEGGSLPSWTGPAGSFGFLFIIAGLYALGYTFCGFLDIETGFYDKRKTNANTQNNFRTSTKPW